MIILRAIREVLGRILIFFDWITRPEKASRSATELAQLSKETSNLSIYQFYACPFCLKTRRALHRLNLPIELRDAQKEGEHRTALLEGGGRVKVPCLRIDGADGEGSPQWLYQSKEIISYLEQRFGAPAQA